MGTTLGDPLGTTEGMKLGKVEGNFVGREVKGGEITYGRSSPI